MIREIMLDASQVVLYLLSYKTRVFIKYKPPSHTHLNYFPEKRDINIFQIV